MGLIRPPCPASCGEWLEPSGSVRPVPSSIKPAMEEGTIDLDAPVSTCVEELRLRRLCAVFPCDGWAIRMSIERCSIRRGRVCTSAGDLVRWTQLLSRGRLLGHDGYKSMKTRGFLGVGPRRLQRIASFIARSPVRVFRVDARRAIAVMRGQRCLIALGDA